jgi:hypothetical protein
MLDVLFAAMFVVVPVLTWGIWEAKVRRNFARHKKVQLTLAAFLLVVIALLEIDIRFFTNWRARAAGSPYFNPEKKSGLVMDLLWIHIGCAIATIGLWAQVIIQAMRRFPDPPAPNAHSRSHVRWAVAGATTLLLTALTACAFYVLAFVV